VWINKEHITSISSLRSGLDGYELRMSNSDRYFITEDVGNKILDLFDLE
jgi:hypothetical protein